MNSGRDDASWLDSTGTLVRCDRCVPERDNSSAGGGAFVALIGDDWKLTDLFAWAA